MGEMADFYIERMQYAYPNWSPVGNVRRTAPTVCRYCGSEAVKWRAEGGGWRLYNTELEHPGNRMTPHDCLAASADDFEDVSKT